MSLSSGETLLNERKLDETVELVRPKTSRGRPKQETSPVRERSPSVEKETEPISTDEDRTTTPHTDLRFIRGTIDRVLEFQPDSQSESSTFNEQPSIDHNQDNEQDESLSSLSTSTKTPSKDEDQPNEKNESTNQVDDRIRPEQKADSTLTNPLFNRSNPNNHRQRSSDRDQISSDDEEIDDTLNDIEDEDSQDDKVKHRQTTHVYQDSPVKSPSRIEKNSQETQTPKRVSSTSYKTGHLKRFTKTLS